MSISTTKRVQGRPVRGAGDVGREKLVEAARTILQIRIPQTISRKAVADAAGVTPALVSYYFPDKAVLVSAATRPVIDERIAELRAILEQDESYRTRLARVVSLLVGLNEREAHIVDLALEGLQRGVSDPAQRAMLVGAYRHLRRFVRDGAASGAWRAVHPDPLIWGLFGMCRAMAQMDALAGLAEPTGEPSPDRVAVIVDVLINGLRP